MMKTPFLHVSNLTKRFGTFNAVDQIDLQVHPGEIYGFLGPNGAGKTTTIKMLAGLLLPDEGQVTIAGNDLLKKPTLCKQLTGYIPDRPFLYEKLTGTEYLRFIASLYSENDISGRLSEASEYLKLFDLTDWQDHLIESYSHGMKQKLIMTSIFMLDQPLIIVDEPMVGLDPKSARIVKELFKKKAATGTAIFLSTHSLEIAEELCDMIAIIVHGRIKASGDMNHLRSMAAKDLENLEDIFLELTGAYELQAVVAALKTSYTPTPLTSKT